MKILFQGFMVLPVAPMSLAGMLIAESSSRPPKVTLAGAMIGSAFILLVLIILIGIIVRKGR